MAAGLDTTDVTVFVYGTLTDADQVATLIDDFAFRGDAVLEGMHTVKGRYKTLAPGGEASGRLLHVADVAPIDEYEGVERGLYTRVQVPLVGGDEAVSVYVGNPEGLDLEGSVTWPGTGLFYDRVPRYVEERDVRVRRVD